MTSQCSPPADKTTSITMAESSLICEKNLETTWLQECTGCKIFIRLVDREACYSDMLRECDWISAPIQETEACYRENVTGLLHQ